jgi:pimeloyl-ACP methyl ester carboxylesterase
MSYLSGYIQLDNLQLHYLKIGAGKKLLLAFHGYGNDASLFTHFDKYLSKDYTIYSFDLPHHGKSHCDDKRVLEKKDVITLVNTLKRELCVPRVSLIGYSMGGRVCLSLVELMPDAIEKVVLIASDGLVFNRFYYFLTNTTLGSGFFKHMLEKPQSYIKLVDWLKRRKVIDTHRHGMAMHYLQSANSRSFLLKVWPCMRQLVPDNAKLRKIIKREQIPVFVFMGAHDKIIPARLAQRFKGNLDSVQLYILDKGHKVMDEETLPQISATLLS